MKNYFVDEFEAEDFGNKIEEVFNLISNNRLTIETESDLKHLETLILFTKVSPKLNMEDQIALVISRIN